MRRVLVSLIRPSAVQKMAVRAGWQTTTADSSRAAAAERWCVSAGAAMQAGGTAAWPAAGRNDTRAFAAQGASTSASDAERGCTPLVSNAVAIEGPTFLITS
jgi:hypothetical protein